MKTKYIFCNKPIDTDTCYNTEDGCMCTDCNFDYTISKQRIKLAHV